MDPSRLDADIMREFQRFPAPSFDLTDVARVRAGADEFVQRLTSRPTPPRTGVKVEDRSVASLIHDYSIPVRVYRPADTDPGRVLIYMHGGAFVVGDLEIEDESCYTWAREADCVVVSVDYRLAPEHKFPAALEDCYSVLQWVADNADELRIDPQRIGIGGCSAGGALVAGLAQLCRDRNGPAIAVQMLLCPILDASMTSPSAKGVPEAEMRNAEQMWEHYLPGSRLAAPEYASPTDCNDLAGLPPAYIVAAELDGLRDEAISYAQRLWAAGVSAEIHVWPRVPHAFQAFFPDAGVAQRAHSEQAAALTRLLG